MMADERRDDMLTTVKFTCTRLVFPREFLHMHPNERTAFAQGATVTLPIGMAGKFIGEGVAIPFVKGQA